MRFAALLLDDEASGLLTLEQAGLWAMCTCSSTMPYESSPIVRAEQAERASSTGRTGRASAVCVCLFSPFMFVKPRVCDLFII